MTQAYLRTIRACAPLSFLLLTLLPLTAQESWTSSDINALPGSTSLDAPSGVFTVRGAGTDIWNAADGFRFVHTALAGDGQIIARVHSLQNTHAWARAGLMIRGSLSVGSANALVAVTPSNGTLFSRRTSDSATTTSNSAGAFAAPRWLKLTRSGNLIRGYHSADGVNWSLFGSATVSLPSTALVGLAVCSKNSSVLAEAVFEQVSVLQGGLPEPIPQPWNAFDLGNGTISGEVALNNGTWSLQAGGANIDGTADAGKFILQPLVGDGSITARIQSVQNVDSWTKSGVMIRETTEAGARNVYLCATPGQGLLLQERSSANGTTSKTSFGAITSYPFYLKLERAGSAIRAYRSTDGLNWTFLGVRSIAMASEVQIGLASTARHTIQVATSVFDQVYVHALPPPWTGSTLGTGPEGRSGFQNGVYRLRASGGSSLQTDDLHFVHQVLLGDGEFIARISGLAGSTNPDARCGWMIRQDLSAASPAAFLALSQGGMATLDSRASSAFPWSTTGFPASGSAVWLKLTRSGSTLQGFTSADGQAWTHVGTATVPLTGPVYAGLAATSADPSAFLDADVDQVSFRSVPPPWNNTDVGPVNVPGTAGMRDQAFHLQASGSDINSTADSFHTTWVPLSGNGSIAARVVSVDPIHSWTKAGVMIREDLTAGSRHAAMVVTPGTSMAFQRRLAAGGNTTTANTLQTSGDKWVRLERQGDTFRAWRSQDGTNWILVGTDTVPMGTDVHMGLVMCSRDNNKLGGAKFEQIRVVNAAGGDSDADGLPDAWETTHGLNPASNDAQIDFDGDGMTNLHEFQNSTNPNDYYNGLTRTITVAPTTQQVDPDAFTTAYLIEVRGDQGQLLPNAPVRLVRTEGMGLLAATSAGAPILATEMELRSGWDGIARVHIRTGIGFGETTRAAIELGGQWAGQIEATTHVPPPHISLVRPLTGQVVLGKSVVGIAADVSSHAPVDHVAFYRGDTLIGVDHEAPWEMQLSDAPSGELQLSAIVTDIHGRTSSTPYTLVEVLSAPNPNFGASGGYPYGISSPQNGLKLPVQEVVDTENGYTEERSTWTGAIMLHQFFSPQGILADYYYTYQETILYVNGEPHWSGVLEPSQTTTAIPFEPPVRYETNELGQTVAGRISGIYRLEVEVVGVFWREETDSEGHVTFTEIPVSFRTLPVHLGFGNVNMPPDVQITRPAHRMIGTWGNGLWITGAASDPDGQVASIQGRVGDKLNASFNGSWSSNPDNRLETLIHVPSWQDARAVAFYSQDGGGSLSDPDTRWYPSPSHAYPFSVTFANFSSDRTYAQGSIVLGIQRQVPQPFSGRVAVFWENTSRPMGTSLPNGAGQPIYEWIKAAEGPDTASSLNCALPMGRYRIVPVVQSADGAQTYVGQPVWISVDLDTDADGLPDNWEIDNGLNPNNPADGATQDTDEDGLDNQTEQQEGTDPTLADTDGDTVLDGEDGWAKVPGAAPARRPVPQYAVVDMGEGAWPHVVNDRGMAVLSRGGNFSLWRPGQTETAIELPEGYTLSWNPPILGISDLGQVLFNLTGPTGFSSNETIPVEAAGGDPEWDYVFYLRSSPKRPLLWGVGQGFTLVGPDTLNMARFVNSQDQWLAYDDYQEGQHEKTFIPVAMNTSGTILGLAEEYAYCLLGVPTAWEETIRHAWTTNSGQIGRLHVNANRDGAYAYDPQAPSASVLYEHETFEPLAISNREVLIGTTYFAPEGEGADYNSADGPLDPVPAYAAQGTIQPVEGLASLQSISPENHLIGTTANGTRALVLDQTAGLRLSQNTTATPNYGEPLVWTSSMGATPPERLNSLLQGLWNNQLWQNTQWHTVAQMVPGTVGPNATWANMTLTALSDHGLLAAQATRTSDNSARAVLLVPIEFGVHPTAPEDEEQTHQVPNNEAEIYLQASLLMPKDDGQGNSTMQPVEDGTTVAWEIDSESSSGGSLEQPESTTTDGHTAVKLTTSRIPGDRYRVRAKLKKLVWNGADIQNSGNSSMMDVDTGWIEVVPGGGDNITFQLQGDGSGSNLPADGKSEKLVTATIKDANGKLVAEGTEVYWHLKGSGQLKDAQKTVDANGQVTVKVVAGTLEANQVLTLQADAYEQSTTLQNQAVSASLSSSSSSLDMHAGQTATLTASFPGVKDGTEVRWFTSKGRLTNAASTVQGGQATATLRTEVTRTGDALVSVAAGGSSAMVRVNFTTSAPIRIAISNPVLAGDAVADGTASVETLDGSSVNVAYHASSTVNISAPAHAGQMATVSLMDTRPSAFARWRMDSISGNATPDEVSGYHATVQGAVLDAQTKHEGNASLYFEGNATLTAAHAHGLRLRDKLTVTAWVYPDQIQAGSLAAKSGEYQLGLDANGRPYFTVQTSQGSQTVTSANPLAPGQWHRVSARYLATGTVEVTVNGATSSASAGGTPASGTQPLVMGQGYSGNLDLVEISEGEHAAGGLPLAISGLDGNGQVQLDASGQASITVQSNGSFNPATGNGHRVAVQVSINPTTLVEDGIAIAPKQFIVLGSYSLQQTPIGGQVLTAVDRQEYLARMARERALAGQRSAGVFPLLTGDALQRSRFGYAMSQWLAPLDPQIYLTQEVFKRAVTSTTVTDASGLNHELTSVILRSARSGSDQGFVVVMKEESGPLIDGLHGLSENHAAAFPDMVRALDGETVFRHAHEVAETFNKDMIEALALLAKAEEFGPSFTQMTLALLDENLPTLPAGYVVDWKNQAANGMEGWLRAHTMKAVNDGWMLPDTAHEVGWYWGLVRLGNGLSNLADYRHVVKMAVSLVTMTADATAGDPVARQALGELVPLMGTYWMYEASSQAWDNGQYFDAGISTFDATFSGVTDLTLIGGVALKGARVVQLTRARKLPLALRVGAAGETWTKALLRRRGYTEILEIKNASGHGIDIVARHRSGHLTFFEVKSHKDVGLPRLSKSQEDMQNFVTDRLDAARNGTGHWQNAPTEVKDAAERLFRELQRTNSIRGVVVNVDNALDWFPKGTINRW